MNGCLCERGGLAEHNVLALNANFVVESNRIFSLTMPYYFNNLNGGVGIEELYQCLQEAFISLDVFQNIISTTIKRGYFKINGSILYNLIGIVK
ncbi:hypothetical protein XCCB1459_2736 [Xanthomonas campestris pv. campestris]|nr:hypothetical protein XCCB1459_2736 [Xanthomonas campestris pv. campestris]